MAAARFGRPLPRRRQVEGLLAHAAAADRQTNTGAAQVEDDVMSEYVPDNVGDQSERGFYICIEGHEKIARRLATFIDEYNVGEYMDPADDMMGMGAIPVGGGMAIPIAVGAGPPPGPTPSERSAPLPRPKVPGARAAQLRSHQVSACRCRAA